MPSQASPNMRAGDLPPAAPIYTTLPIKEPGPVVEQPVYVPPALPLGSPFTRMVHVDVLMDAHKFIEINAIFPEHKALADKLRDILEG